MRRYGGYSRGGEGAGPCYFSTLNIRCIGELVFIPYTRQPRENFPIGVGLRNEVRLINTISRLLLGRVPINY